MTNATTNNASLSEHAEPFELIIEPRKGWIGVDWGELVRCRELLAFLVWRDFAAKYKQAFLGVAWAIIIPVISLGIYGLVASATGWADQIGGAPLMLWMLAGLIPWLYIQRSISDGGMSLLNNMALMTKVYMPRLFIPAASCGNALVDTAIHFLLLLLLGVTLAVTGNWAPSWQIIFVIPLMLMTVVIALGLALTLSAATVLFRDLRFLIPFLVQFGLWLSAVPYPLNIYDSMPAGELIKNLYALNPITGIISGFRSAITDQPWQWLHVSSSIVIGFALLLFGLFFFKRVERRFADIA